MRYAVTVLDPRPSNHPPTARLFISAVVNLKRERGHWLTSDVREARTFASKHDAFAWLKGRVDPSYEPLTVPV